MNRASWTVILITLVMFISLVAYIIIQSGSLYWFDTFRPMEDHPYDIGMLDELLERSPDHARPVILNKPVTEWREQDWNGRGVLAYYRSYPSHDSAHTARIDSLLKSGSVAVITGPDGDMLGHWLRTQLLDADSLAFYDNPYEALRTDSTGSEAEDSVYVPFDPIIHQQVQKIYARWNYVHFDTLRTRTVRHLSSGQTSTVAFARKNDTVTISYAYIRAGDLEKLLPEAEVTLMDAEDDSRVLAFRLRKGKGWYEIYLEDRFFTNYGLNNPDNFELVSRLAAEWPGGGYVHDYYDPDLINPGFRGDPGALAASPLNFILSQPSLRWAWYTLMVALMLFAFFRIKRRQRIIPVMNPPVNQSLEFAQTIGLLAYREGSHLAIAQELFRQFEQWSRERLRNRHDMQSTFRDHLKAMHPDQIAEIETLFYLHARVAREQEITAEELNRIYQITRFVYEQSRS